jgi:hypothetical protein
MPAIYLGDLTGCTAHQRSFEAVKTALNEIRRSRKVGLETPFVLAHRGDRAGPVEK